MLTLYNFKMRKDEFIMSRKVSSRVKAAVVCAAMLSTAIATPTLVTNIVTPSTMSAQAAALKTMKADDVYTTYIGDLVKKDAKTISFTITPNYTGNFSYGLGIGISEPPYWQEYDSKKGFTDSKDSKGNEISINSSQVAVKKGEPVTITFDVSKLSLRYEADQWNKTSSEIQFRAYYTGEGSSDSVELTSVKANDTSAPVTPTKPSEPETEEETKAPSKPAGKDETVDANVTIDDVTDSDSKTNVFTGYITDYATSGIKTITLNLESETVLNNFTFGFGINTASDPYWYEYSADGKWVDTKGGTVSAVSSKRIPTTKEFSVTIDVSSLDLKYIDDAYGRAKFEFRNYYSAGEKVTVKSVTINTSKNTDAGEPEPNDNGSGYPEVVNKSEVTYDEANHKAVLKNTITRKISGESIKDAAVLKNSTLTPGYDEESYLDDTGLSTYKEGDPINSIKFGMGAFGVSEGRLAGKATIDSISVTLSSDVDVARLMYGGGISVQNGSVADTEYPKQIAGLPKKENAGYWYNDCGPSELDAFNEMLEIYKQKATPEQLVDVITPKQGYDITDESVLGKYFTVTWDVPDEVKPYVTATGDISFQYWYGEKAVENDGDDATLGALNVEEAYLTYTEETTIPYTGKTETKVNKKVANDDKYEVKYSDLGIKSYQNVYAVILNVNTKADNQMVFDYSTSTTTADNYYITSSAYSNYCIPKADGTFDMMWIMPSNIASYQEGVSDYNYVDSDGSLTFYNFYTADHSATPVKSDVTINDITVLYRDGLSLSDSEIELEVGESKTVTATLDGVTYKSANESVASVKSDGTITGLKKGVTTVTVVAPDGQSATVKVTVKEAATEPTTTTATTTTTTTTTKAATTTTKAATTTTKAVTTAKVTTTVAEPTETFKDILWGDVNVDDKVTVADTVLLNKYLVNSAVVSNQGLRNADCWYDKSTNANDSLTILKIVVGTYTQNDMPVIPD